LAGGSCSGFRPAGGLKAAGLHIRGHGGFRRFKVQGLAPINTGSSGFNRSKGLP